MSRTALTRRLQAISPSTYLRFLLLTGLIAILTTQSAFPLAHHSGQLSARSGPSSNFAQVGPVTTAQADPSDSSLTIPIRLWYNSDGHYGETEPAVARTIAASLNQTCCLSVRLESEPWVQYVNDFGNGKLPFFLLGWYPDYFDSDGYVSPFLTAAGASVLSEYNNTQVDAWISQEETTTNVTLRAQLFQLIQNQLAVDVPYIPLWQGTSSIVYNQDLRGVYLNPIAFRYSFMSSSIQNNTLVVGTTDRAYSFDPAAAYDYFSLEVINQIFDTLLVYNPTNSSLIPGLATEVPSLANGLVTPDGMSYTYHLRSGLTFSDGSPLNSTMVKNSILRAISLDIPGSAAFLLYDVGGLSRSPRIDTPDPTTIVFHLAHAVSFFNSIMAFSLSAPVPWWYSSTSAQPDGVGTTVGSGPYTLAGYASNTQITLAANPRYSGARTYAASGFPAVPMIHEVTIDMYDNSSALKQAIVTHAVDMAYRTLSTSDLLDLEARASSLGLRVDVGVSPQIRYLVFNVNTPPFNDPRVRRAIAYAINRTAIINDVFSGTASPLYSTIPSFMTFSEPVFATTYGASPVLNSANSLLSQVVSGAFDYSLSNNGPTSIEPGSSGTVTITAVLKAGTAQPVTLSCVSSSLLAGITCGSFTVNPLTPTSAGAYSDLTVRVASSVAAGSYSFQVTSSPLGATTTPTTVGVTVTAVKASTSVSVSCSPSSIDVGRFTTCSANVTGLSPSGDVLFSSSSSTGTFTTTLCALSAGACAVTYAEAATSNLTATITASYTGDTDNNPNTGTFSLSIAKPSGIIAVGTTSTTVTNGGFSANQGSATGISVTITGSTAANGTQVGVTTQTISALNSGIPAPTLSSPSYYDVLVTGISSGNAQVCISFSSAGSSTTMQYWGGTSWTRASSITVSGGTVCGTIPVSALAGTNIVLGNTIQSTPPQPTIFGLNPTLFYAIVGALVAVIIIVSAALVVRARGRNRPTV